MHLRSSFDSTGCPVACGESIETLLSGYLKNFLNQIGLLFPIKKYMLLGKMLYGFPRVWRIFDARICGKFYCSKCGVKM